MQNISKNHSKYSYVWFQYYYNFSWLDVISLYLHCLPLTEDWLWNDSDYFTYSLISHVYLSSFILRSHVHHWTFTRSTTTLVLFLLGQMASWHSPINNRKKNSSRSIDSIAILYYSIFQRNGNYGRQDGQGMSRWTDRKIYDCLCREYNFSAIAYLILK